MGPAVSTNRTGVTWVTSMHASPLRLFLFLQSFIISLSSASLQPALYDSCCLKVATCLRSGDLLWLVSMCPCQGPLETLSEQLDNNFKACVSCLPDIVERQELSNRRLCWNSSFSRLTLKSWHYTETEHDTFWQTLQSNVCVAPQ